MTWHNFWDNWLQPFVVNVAAGLATAGLLYVLARWALRKKSLQARIFQLLGIDELARDYKQVTARLLRRRHTTFKVNSRLLDVGVTTEESQQALLKSFQDMMVDVVDISEQLNRCQDRFDGMLKTQKTLDNQLSGDPQLKQPKE